MTRRAAARVLHLIPSMAGGGAEKQLTLLAGALHEQGWEVEVGILNGGVNLDRLERSGANVHWIRSSHAYDPAILLRIGRLIQKVDPALVQTWLPQMDVAGGIAALTHRVPWIVSERGTRPLGHSLKRRVRDLLTARATAVVSNSEEALRLWKTRRPAMPLFHVPNALAREELLRACPADLSRFKVTPRSGIVLNVARLVAGKNLEAFRAAMLLVTREIDAVAMICGIGPERDELTEQIRRDGLADRVLLPGYVPDIATWMKAADVMVSVSMFEGRPNAVMEAMACGTPLVVSNIPEHREILDEQSALLVDPADPHDIARAILETLRNPEAAQQRATAATRAVDSWTPAAVAADYAQIYSALARSR